MFRCAGAVVVVGIWSLAGCQPLTPKAPEYIVHLDGVRRSPEQAQAILIERTLARQINPPLDAPLRALSVPMPPYPSGIRRGPKAIEGTVQVKFVVGESGAASDAVVVGTPNPLLAAICVATVLDWKFEPPKRGGAPTTVPLSFEFRFRLEN